MDDKALRGLLGLCARAGQAVFGEEGCKKALAEGECGVLLLDGGVSENTRKRYETLCERTGTPLIETTEDLISQATGRNAMAMALRKGTLCDRVLDRNEPNR